ncbi:MAG: hypothetical protein JOZ90_12935 [Alphaproteobacteria bacterium]|nr:hypothetical protein [Alphaproteobacteria bacterium]MBV9370365.1 hypothetical protein [Alphaproteobacteria bacterium]MBV9901978.1 hypothetical protein [Alphaproteobacteria bacterium]
MVISLIAALAAAAVQPALRPGLEPLGFLVGHCWRGEIKPGQFDTHCFEPVFGGQHVRDRHKVAGAGSPYEGETLYSWDGAAIAFTYWNSLGGVSRGFVRAEAGGLNFGEQSYRGANGERVSIATSWRRVGPDSFEAVVASAGRPSLDRTTRFHRID